jgi:hypothetical protein
VEQQQQQQYYAVQRQQQQAPVHMYTPKSAKQLLIQTHNLGGANDSCQKNPALQTTPSGHVYIERIDEVKCLLDDTGFAYAPTIEMDPDVFSDCHDDFGFHEVETLKNELRKVGSGKNKKNGQQVLAELKSQHKAKQAGSSPAVAPQKLPVRSAPTSPGNLLQPISSKKSDGVTSQPSRDDFSQLSTNAPSTVGHSNSIDSSSFSTTSYQNWARGFVPETPSSHGLRSPWGQVQEPSMNTNRFVLADQGMNSAYMYTEQPSPEERPLSKSAPAGQNGRNKSKDPTEGDEDAYKSQFRTTITVIHRPIDLVEQPKNFPRRTRSWKSGGMNYNNWNILEIDTGDDIHMASVDSCNSYVLKERASMENLKLSAHPAPWPTCTTPLHHPNYSLPQFTEKVEKLFDEFALGGDFQGFIQEIDALNCRQYHDSLVSTVFRKSLDVPDNSCALDYAGTTKILQSLVNERGMVSPSSLFRGIYGWISQISDLEVDVPHASYEVMNLLEELVADSVLEPAVLCRVPSAILEKAGREKYKNILVEMREFKNSVHAAMVDYFKCLNLKQLEEDIVELNMPTYHHEIVNEAIITSMDFSQEERKLVGKMFQYLLKQGVLIDEDIQHGVALSVGQVDELSQTDVPFSKAYFVRILADCVKEEVVSADLVKKFRTLHYGGWVGESAFQEILHCTPEYSRKIWGCDKQSTLTSLLEEINTSIDEYFDSRDAEEVARIVGELHLTRDLDVFFIKQVILKSMEKNKFAEGLQVLLHLQNVYWTREDFETAIEAIRNEENDLVLDFPAIHTAVEVMIFKCRELNLISDEFYRLAGIQYEV